MINKQYLGDSVYAYWDGFHIVLTTENGRGPTNTIYLEDSVIAALKKFETYIAAHIAELAKERE